MAIFEIASDRLKEIPETTFQAVGLRERQDLLRLLRQQVSILLPDTLVIAEEHGHGPDRRIDLLAVDRSGALVVIDLEGSRDDAYTELRALRCAASVASLSFEQAVASHQRFLARHGQGEENARARLLAFLGWAQPDSERFGHRMRVVLVAPDFSDELTQTVLWLRGEGIDLRCVRVRPYSYGKRLMLDVSQVVPAPEVASAAAG